MKSVKLRVIISVYLCLAMLSVVTAEQTQRWPREQVSNGNVLVMQQPKVDDWKNKTELFWHMAFTLTTPSDKAVPGIVSLQGDTNVDNQSGMVLISNIKVVAIKFPSLNPGQTDEMSALLTTFIPQTLVLPLAQVEADIKSGSAVRDNR